MMPCCLACMTLASFAQHVRDVHPEIWAILNPYPPTTQPPAISPGAAICLEPPELAGDRAATPC